MNRCANNNILFQTLCVLFLQPKWNEFYTQNKPFFDFCQLCKIERNGKNLPPILVLFYIDLHIVKESNDTHTHMHEWKKKKKLHVNEGRKKAACKHEICFFFSISSYEFFKFSYIDFFFLSFLLNKICVLWYL